MLLVGLCTGLVAYYSGVPMGGFSQTDGPSELSYVPAERRPRRLLQRPGRDALEMRQRSSSSMPQHEEGQAEFEQATGINIERDIDHVIAFPDADQHDRALYAAWSWPAGASTWSVSKGWRASMAARSRNTRASGSITQRSPTGNRRRAQQRQTVAFMAPGLVALGDTTVVKRAHRRRRRQQRPGQ